MGQDSIRIWVIVAAHKIAAVVKLDNTMYGKSSVGWVNESGHVALAKTRRCGHKREHIPITDEGGHTESIRPKTKWSTPCQHCRDQVDDAGIGKHPLCPIYNDIFIFHGSSARHMNTIGGSFFRFPKKRFAT